MTKPPKGPNTDSYLQEISRRLHLEGDVAECGVYQGHNTYYYASLLKGKGKKLFAFDSFKGFPENNEDIDQSKFKDTNLDLVKKMLSNFDNVQIIPGFFENTLKQVSKNRFCCVILDCDLYSSYKECLNFFYDKITPGGSIIFDEYFSIKYPKAKLSVDEFFADKPEKPEIFKIEDNQWERWRIVKL